MTNSALPENGSGSGRSGEKALILLPSPKGCQHEALPAADETMIPLGTLARCDCGRWFRHADTFSGNWSPLSSWVPVRWYHLRSRRRIEHRTPPGDTTTAPADPQGGDA